MKRRCMAVILSLVLLFSLLVSCGKMENKSLEAVPEKDTLRIGVSFDTLILERWTRDRDVFVSTAEQLGATVDFQNANSDIVKQKQQIENFISDGVDVIVIVAVDCFQLAEEVSKARKKGIKVVSYDRLIQGCMTDLYITVDNEKVGELMAQTVMEHLPNGGSVVMLNGPEDDTNATDVANGFEKKIDGSNLKVVKKISVRSWAPENGFAAANEALADVEEVDAVICGNDGLAGYAIKALIEKQLAGKVVVVGQDADLEACQRVVEGTQTMTVYKPVYSGSVVKT